MILEEDNPCEGELSYPCMRCVKGGSIIKDENSGHWICDICGYDYTSNRDLVILTDDSDD